MVICQVSSFIYTSFFLLLQKIYDIFFIQFINHNIASIFSGLVHAGNLSFPLYFLFILHFFVTHYHEHQRWQACTAVLPVPHLEKLLKALRLGTGIHKNHKQIKYTLKEKIGRLDISNSQFSTTWSNNIYENVTMLTDYIMQKFPILLPSFCDTLVPLAHSTWTRPVSPPQGWAWQHFMILFH